MATTIGDRAIRSPHASVRRSVLKRIRDVRSGLGYLAGRWDVRSTVYVSPADRKPGDNVYWRPRELEEYPEAKPAELDHLAEWADSLAQQLANLALGAREHAALLRSEEER